MLSSGIALFSFFLATNVIVFADFPHTHTLYYKE